MGLLNERLSHETKPLKSETKELKQTVRERAVRTKRKAAAKSYERSEEHRVKECQKIQMDSAQINKKRNQSLWFLFSFFSSLYNSNFSANISNTG